MSNKTNPPQYIEERVTAAIKYLAAMDVDHDFGETALQEFEDYIEFDRGFMSKEIQESMLAMCGAYLGECIRRKYGGIWIESESGGWGIQPEGSTWFINVFGKVAKWIASGATGDSFVDLYRRMPMLLEQINRPKHSSSQDDEFTPSDKPEG